MQDFMTFIQHHWALSFALAVVLLILLVVEFIKLKRSAARISPAQLTQLINRDNAYIVDLRNYDAYQKGHVIGSVSIPFSELKDKLKKLDAAKSQTVVLVCAMGLESQKAANLLKENGFNSHILSGGIRAWTDAQMPLVKE